MTGQRAADEEQATPAAEEAAGATESAEEASERVSEDLDELAQAQRERDEYLELAQRTRADFDNYRKRVAGEAKAAQARGKGEFARELIPVIDTLEQAFESANDDGPLARGIKLVLAQLAETLERAGIESYDPAGQGFDPNLHEAVSALETESVAPGTVLETLARGYRLDGQVLRPARVVVSK